MSKINLLIIDSFSGLGGEEEVAFYLYKYLPRDVFNVRIMAESSAKYFQKNRPIDNEFIDHKVRGRFDFRSMLSFRKIIETLNIDIIHIHGYSAGFFVRLACIGMRKCKIVWTMHLNINDVNMNPLKKKLRVVIENLINNSLLTTNMIVCVANNAKKNLINRGVRRIPIRVIYNGIDIEFFKDVALEKKIQNVLDWDLFHV